MAGYTPGNPEWDTLCSQPGVKNGGLEELDDEDLDIATVTSLIAQIIKDSKYNVVRKNKYAESSRKFLENQDGALSYLLRLTNVNNQDLCTDVLAGFCSFHEVDG